MRRAVLFACVALSACVEPPQLDGGVDGGDGGHVSWEQLALVGAGEARPVALTGAQHDVWAALENGQLFRSTGGDFSEAVQFSAARDLFVTGGTVVLLQTRFLRTCTSGCDEATSYDQLDLNNSAANWNYFGVALCGEGPEHIVAVTTDTANAGKLFEWNGQTWSLGTSIPIYAPESCWFGPDGALYVAGSGGVVHLAHGAMTAIALGESGGYVSRGVTLDGTAWAVGAKNLVAKGTGIELTELPTDELSNVLLAAGGFSGDEVYLLGSYSNLTGPGYVWNGAELKPLGRALPPFDSSAGIVRAMLRTGPQELFIAGTVGLTPVILRGRK